MIVTVIVLGALCAVLALTLMWQNLAFADQIKSVIAQADERVKSALSQEEKAYMAFHAAASPQTFAMFRNWSGGAVIGSQYPTTKHYKTKAPKNPAPLKIEVPRAPLFERNGHVARDPDENINVSTTTGFDDANEATDPDRR